jgi:hypothetical protein
MKTYNVTTDTNDVIKVTTDNIEETIEMMSAMLSITVLSYEESVVQIPINVWKDLN